MDRQTEQKPFTIEKGMKIKLVSGVTGTVTAMHGYSLKELHEQGKLTIEQVLRIEAGVEPLTVDSESIMIEMVGPAEGVDKKRDVTYMFPAICIVEADGKRIVPKMKRKDEQDNDARG